MEALQPESYFGEGPDYLTFVTRNSGLFEDVLKVLDSPKDDQSGNCFASPLT
jgi:hypothetical protein